MRVGGHDDVHDGGYEIGVVLGQDETHAAPDDWVEIQRSNHQLAGVVDVVHRGRQGRGAGGGGERLAPFETRTELNPSSLE